MRVVLFCFVVAQHERDSLFVRWALLPLKRTRAQAQFDSVVTGCILEAVYRQLECVHDMGLNETRPAEGAGREHGGVEGAM